MEGRAGSAPELGLFPPASSGSSSEGRASAAFRDEDATGDVDAVRGLPRKRAFQVKDEEVRREARASARGSPGDRLQAAQARDEGRAGEEQCLVDVMDATSPVVKDHGPDAGQSRKPAVGLDLQVHSQSSVVRVHFPLAWMQVAPASTRFTLVAKNAPQNRGSASW